MRKRKTGGLSPEAKKLRRENIKVAQALLLLGCATAKDLPDMIWRRETVKALRQHRYDFNTGTEPPRVQAYRFKASSTIELLNAVRKGLGFNRLPSGMGDKIAKWGIQFNPKVMKRRAQKYVDTYWTPAGRMSRMQAIVEERIIARARECAFARRLIRAAHSPTNYIMARYADAYYYDTNPAAWLARIGVQLRASGAENKIKPDTGQLLITASVTIIGVTPAWYSQVEKRGIAVIEGALVLKVLPGAVRREVGLVLAARPAKGFQIVTGWYKIKWEGGKPSFVHDITQMVQVTAEALAGRPVGVGVSQIDYEDAVAAQPFVT